MARSSFAFLPAVLGCALALLLATETAAQCLDPVPAGSQVVLGDDVLSGHVPLGFAFPMAGSAGTGNWTHVRISTNGWLALTNGVTDQDLPAANGYGSVAAASTSSLYGPLGSNPRLAPYWTNFTVTPPGGVFVDTTGTAGSSARILWYQVHEPFGGASRIVQAELFATGVVAFRYWGTATNLLPVVCGLSAANGTAPQPAADLVPGPATTNGPGMHQTFAVGAQDLDWMGITFTPQGNGYHVLRTCGMPASHESYGSGCYSSPAQGFYQLFPTAAAAATALTMHGVEFTIAGNSYAASWQPMSGVSALFPTGFASSLVPSDDGSDLVPLPYPMPTPDGPVTHLRVNHNGVVHLGSANASPHDGDFTPSGAEFASCNLAGFYCWHDFDDTQGSPAITYELVGNVFCVTWPYVESYAYPETANPSFVQFQFDVQTGTVRILWMGVSPNSSSPFGSSYLVGYKGLGPIAEPGSTTLTTTLPASFRFGITPAMSLWATPAPYSTPAVGATVTYTHDWVPEYAPGARLGVTILSLGQDLAGTSLAAIGMPGCNLHLTSLDAMLPFATSATTPTTSFTLPPAVLSGTRLYAQAAALVPPGSANALGIVLSDAVASTISWY